MEGSPSPIDTAIFGGSFNPPGLHHRALAALLLANFDRVLVVPCGFRPDKAGTTWTWLAPAIRQEMIRLTFAGLDGDAGQDDAPGKTVPAGLAGLDGQSPTAGRLEFDWSDLARDRFTPTIELARRFRDRGRLWFVAGADLFAGGGRGESQIQREWLEGHQIWRDLNWVCLTRPGYAVDAADLPPRHRLLACDFAGSSSEIRRRLGAGEAVDELVAPGVAGLLQAAE